jgi:putative adenylate-forming enzyme
MGADALPIAAHFARARWGAAPASRAALEAHQQRALRRFLRQVLPRAPLYRGQTIDTLEALPLMDKADLMRDFDQRNTRGIRLEQALALALQAETSRDFSPTLGDITVGLSSGTSGNRGVFLVSAAERRRWAGVLLARALPPHLLPRLLTPWAPPVRVAFFLRANSNLYETLGSRRLAFAFFDLLEGVQAALPRLRKLRPDVLVGTPQLLRALAQAQRAGRLDIGPSHILSVAERLEDADADAVAQAFGAQPHQLYQATEGFLGHTCALGGLHLNERFVHIEPQWLDAARTRFVPVVTDFTRETQLIVRYRLNDVLRLAERPCSCGNPERTLAAIEGRSDEVLWLPASDSRLAVPVFPDAVRRCMALAGPAVHEFEVEQQGMVWQVRLAGAPDAPARVAQALAGLWQQLGAQAPALAFGAWQAQPLHQKRRRVRLAQAPEGLACRF